MHSNWAYILVQNTNTVKNIRVLFTLVTVHNLGYNWPLYTTTMMSISEYRKTECETYYTCEVLFQSDTEVSSAANHKDELITVQKHSI